MCADAGFHADQARREIGEPRFHLATRPLLPQHDGAARVVAHDVERVFANIDADHGDCAVGLLRHGVLLVFGAPRQLLSLTGLEHGRTIPLAILVALRSLVSTILFYTSQMKIGTPEAPPPPRSLCRGARSFGVVVDIR